MAGRDKAEWKGQFGTGLGKWNRITWTEQVRQDRIKKGQGWHRTGLRTGLMEQNRTKTGQEWNRTGLRTGQDRWDRTGLRQDRTGGSEQD